MILTLPLAATWFSGCILSVFDGRRKWVVWSAAGALSVCLFFLLVLAYRVLNDGPVSMVAGGWPAGIGITLRADPLGITFALLATTLLLFALLFEALGQVEETKFPSLVLFLTTGLNGLFLTGDVFNFYVFFEVSMTSSFILASYGKENRQARNALTFAAVNIVGSVLFLTGIAGLYHVTGTLDMQQMTETADRIAPGSMLLLGAILLAAFGVKLGLFPFHFWLPSIYRGTHPVIAAVLSGVLANIGSYGLLRFGTIFRHELENAGLVVLCLGSASILYGGFQAVSCRTAREVLAYSSISQAGYIMIGLGVGGRVGYASAILFAITNAASKTLLFLAAGTRGRLVAAAFAIGAFSVAGLPPSVGFFGKAAILIAGIGEDGKGAVRPSVIIGVVLLGSVLSLIYMFQIYQKTFWARPEMPNLQDVRARRLAVFVLAVAVLGLGLWPEPLLFFTQQAAAIAAGGSR